MFLARFESNSSCYLSLLKVCLSIALLFSFSFLSAQYQQVVINEVSGDGGNIEARNDAIVELAGPPGTDIGCMVITNTEWAVVLPAATIIPTDGVFLVGCSSGNNGGTAVYTGVQSGLSCSVCDFPGLVVDFDVCHPANANYVSTSLYTTYGFTLDNGYCGANRDGDQVLLFRPDGTPHDAIFWGAVDATGSNGGGITIGGSSGNCGSMADHVAVQLGLPYLLGDNDDNGIVNDYIGTHIGYKANGGNATGVNKMPIGNTDLGNPFISGESVTVPIGDCNATAQKYIVPSLSDPIWVHAGLALVGCNSTHIRLNDSSPSGNSEQKIRPFTNSSHRDDPDLNANWVSYSANNLVPSSSNPVTAAQQWQITNHPNPGLPNDTDAWDFFYDIGEGLMEITDPNFITIPLCEEQSVQFLLKVYNYQHVEPLMMTNNKAGSFIQEESGSTQNWQIVSVGSDQTVGATTSNNDGTTTFQFTSNSLSTGTSNNFTLVWDDYTNCCGSGSIQTVISQSNPNECYERIKVQVIVTEPFQVTTTSINCPEDFEEGIGMIDFSTLVDTPTSHLEYTLKENVTIGQEGSTGNTITKSKTGVLYLPDYLVTPIAVIIEDQSGCTPPQVISVSGSCKAVPPCPTLGLATLSSSSLCPDELFTLSIDASTSSNLPDGGQIDWYYGTDTTFDPLDPTSTGYGGVLSQASSIEVEGPNCPTDGANVFISELSDPLEDWACHRYIEIYNGGPCVQDLTGWTLYSIGNNNQIISFPLSGTIAVGQALIASASCATQFTPDFIIPNGEAWSEGLSINFNGQSRDGAELYDPLGNLIDVAVLNTEDTNDWFMDNVAIRKPTICEGLTANNTLCGTDSTCTYLDTHWDIMTGINNATPQSHTIYEAVCPPSSYTTTIRTATNDLATNFCNQTLYLKGVVNPAVETSHCPATNFTTNALPVIVECPQASLIPKDINLCTPVSAQEILATINLTGGSAMYNVEIALLENANTSLLSYQNITSPLELTYADISDAIGNNSFSDVELSIVSVTDAQGNNCSGIVDKESIFLTVLSTPSVSLVASSDITDCLLDNGSITFEIEPANSGPWHIEYTLDNGTPLSLSILASPFTFPAKAGVYQVVSIVSENGCAGEVITPTSQTVASPSPLSIQAISPAPICNDGKEFIHLEEDITFLLESDNEAISGNAIAIGNLTWYRENPLDLPLPIQNSLLLADMDKQVNPTNHTDYYYLYKRPSDNCEVLGKVRIEVDDSQCCYANTGIIELENTITTICQGEEIGKAVVLFNETTPDPLSYDYTFLLVDQMGSLLQFNDTGDFDYTSLTNGQYTIHGLSYKNANDPTKVDVFLENIFQDEDPDDLAQINNSLLCLQLTTVDEAIPLTIHPIPTASFTSSTNIHSCQDASGFITLEITPISNSPYQIIYRFNDSLESTLQITESPFQIPITNVGTYELIQITNQQGCEGILENTTVQISNEIPVLTALDVSTDPICGTEGTQLNLEQDIIISIQDGDSTLMGTATQLGNITWYTVDPSNLFQQERSSSALSGEALLISPTTTTNYYFMYQRFKDGCETVGTTQILVDNQLSCPTPIATITSIPTLTQWGLILFTLLLLNISLLLLRKIEAIHL